MVVDFVRLSKLENDRLKIIVQEIEKIDSEVMEIEFLMSELKTDYSNACKNLKESSKSKSQKIMSFKAYEMYRRRVEGEIACFQERLFELNKELSIVREDLVDCLSKIKSYERIAKHCQREEYKEEVKKEEREIEDFYNNSRFLKDHDPC